MYSVITMERYGYNRKHIDTEMVALTYFLNVYADFYCLYIDKHITKHMKLIYYSCIFRYQRCFFLFGQRP